MGFQRQHSMPSPSQPRRTTSNSHSNHNSQMMNDKHQNQNQTVNNTGRSGGGGAGQNPGHHRPSNMHKANSMRSSGSNLRGSGSRYVNDMNMPVPEHSAAAMNNPTWFGSSNANPAPPPNRMMSSQHQQYGGDDDDDDRTMATAATLNQALRPSAINRARDMTYPQGDVTIIYTDVQGSTSLWESCPTDMKRAQDIHDIIMRQCYTNHSGYEITTEGDAFNLAFQYPIDALAFALQAQLKLYKANWPEGILRHPDGTDDPVLKMRGFRVRFGIHHGPTTSRVHEMTGRTVYSGEGVKIAKAVEGMCHGGQILTTMETWKAVSGMAERVLGRPQILDCGEHLLFESKVPNHETGGITTTRYTRRIMQLVPSDLAFDFFEARGRKEVPLPDGKMGFEMKDASTVNGRLFPPVISRRQLTTSFLNAPYVNGKVTICFVYTVGLEDNPAINSRNLMVLAKYVRKQMLGLNPPGYECQEDNGCWMLAFDRMVNAVFFGLQLKNVVQEAQGLVGNVDRQNMFKVGVLSGPFTSMGPHRTTGMADYFGPIVNRAARVCSNCEPGQVCVGIPLTKGVTADPPDFGDTVKVRWQGNKKLKGITIDVAIFSCSMRKIESIYR